MDETYLRVRSAGSQGSFLTRQYLEEVLPQSSFFRRFPVPDLEISSPEESRGKGARVLFSVPSAVNLFPCPGRAGRKASLPLFPERTPLPG